HTDQYTEDELKGAIIEHGVVSAGMALMHHAMALVGYKKDQDDGQTIWIFKNSWGKKWGENGYANIKAAIDNFGGTHAILSPVYSKIPYDIHCLDLDGDGYYNWGISKNKPSSCPAIARMEKDCDDANSLLGPYRKDGSCASIQTVYPDVAYNHVNESYLVVYDSLQKIYGKFIDNSGLPMGGEFVISEFSGYQRRPSVVFDGENSRYLVTWTEANEATSSDISGQLVNSDGGLLGDKLSISSALSMQSNAELAFDPSTQTYLVVWQDYRSNVASAYDIYAQRLDANGNRLGTNFVISVDVENPDLKPRYNQVYPYVAYNITTSDFLVTWTDERESVTEDRIYGQLVSNSGTLIGTNFPISDKISENQLHSPVIYDEANRRFVVIWMDNRNRETTSTDIYGQLLDDDVVPIGDNFVISNADAVQDSPDMSYDIKSESVLVVWRDGRNRGLGQTGYGILGNWDIYGQTGTIATDSFIKNGENFVVSDMLGGQISPALSCNTDMSNFMAVFSSYGPGGSTLWDWPEIDVVIVSSKGAIKGDLNNDQKVDMSDYQVLKAALGLCEGDAGYEALADYDGDSCITYSDYREWYVQYKYYQNL
ncbi:MAG: C1 family peptidase, partial [Chromatiales bacterium]